MARVFEEMLMKKNMECEQFVYRRDLYIDDFDKIINDVLPMVRIGSIAHHHLDVASPLLFFLC